MYKNTWRVVKKKKKTVSGLNKVSVRSDLRMLYNSRSIYEENGVRAQDSMKRQF